MDEKEAQQKLLMYQVFQGQLEELKKQAVAIQQRFIDVEITDSAVSEVKSAKEGTEALIPLGNGVFVNGELKKGELLVDVGAGIMTHKTSEEASAILGKKRKEIEHAGEGLQSQMEDVVAKINEIGSELEKMVKG